VEIRQDDRGVPRSLATRAIQAIMCKEGGSAHGSLEVKFWRRSSNLEFQALSIKLIFTQLEYPSLVPLIHRTIYVATHCVRGHNTLLYIV
jgi:hypothetical protein